MLWDYDSLSCSLPTLVFSLKTNSKWQNKDVTNIAKKIIVLRLFSPLHSMSRQTKRQTESPLRRIEYPMTQDSSTLFLPSFLTPWKITYCFINLSGIKEKTDHYPLQSTWKHLGREIQQKSVKQGRVKGQRETFVSAFLHYSWHNFFSIVIRESNR